MNETSKDRLTAQTIAVAVGAPLSGSSALLGAEMKQAIEFAIDEKNVAGGILGARIATQVSDDKGNVPQGEAVARDVCATPNVLGVVGHYNSDVTLAASTIYHACGLAMITPIASNPALTERGLANVFRLTDRDDCTGAAIATYLYRTLGKRRAVVVETATVYGQSMADRFAQAFARLGGNVVERRTVKEGERNFATLINTLPRDFDLLFYGGSFEGAYILRAMRSVGLSHLFASGDGCWDVNNFLKPAGEAATVGEGVLVLSAAPEIGWVPGSQEFAERYTRRYGLITNYAVNAYDASRLLLWAIEQAAQAYGRLPERADVVAAMRRLRFQGIAYHRPHEWDAKGDNLAAVTALHVVEGDRYRQIAEIGRDHGDR